MICTKTGKNCSYGTWMEQRLEIAKIVVKYLESRIPEIQEILEEKLADGDEDEENHYIHDVVKIPTIDLEYQIGELQKRFIKPFNETTDDDRKYKVVENPDVYHLKEELCYFGVYGIHLLLRQGDCGGLYSIGESMEILQMFNTIKPYFDTASEIYQTVFTIESDWSSPIYEIFKDSVINLQPVRIT